VRAALVLILTAAVAIITFRDVFYGALAILATFVLFPVVVEQTYGYFYRFHIPQVLYAVTLLSLLAAGKRYLPRLAPRTLPDWGMIAFLLVMTASSIANGDDPFTNRRVALFFKAAVLYFLLSRTADSPKKVLAIVWVIALSAIYLAFISWRKYRTGEVAYARPAIWMSIHQFGMQLVIALPMVGALIRRVRLPLKFLLLGCVGLIVLVGLRTQSRSAYLGLGVGLVMLGWYHRKQPVLLIPALLLVSYAVLHNPERVLLRLQSIWTHRTPTGEVDRSIESRFAQMDVALRVFKSSPLLGIGPHRFFETYLDWANERQAGFLGGRYNMHSIPLLILAEEGLAGILTYYGLLMLGSFLTVVRIARLTRGKPEMEALAVAGAAGSMSFVAFLAYGLGQPSMWQISIYGTVALVSAAEYCALAIAQEREAPQETEVDFARPQPATEVVFS